jgi:hypothetical protein
MSQVLYAIDAYNEWKGDRCMDNLKEYITKISTEKHQSTTIDFDLLASENIKVSARKDNDDEKAEQFDKKQAAFKKRQSENMTGKSRGQMTIEHSVALSIALKEKLHPVSDDEITAVREALAQGETHKSIMEKMNLSRSVVQNIARKKLILLDEIDPEEIKESIIQKRLDNQRRATMTDAQKEEESAKHISIGKRKFSPHVALSVISYAAENPTILPSALTEKSNELFGMTLTNIQVKHLLNGITKFYESEFPIQDMSYSDYLELLKTIKGQQEIREQAKKDVVSRKLRKFNAETIIKVLEKSKEITKSTALSDMSEELFGVHISETSVRGILNKKTRIYDDEFPVNGWTREMYNDFVR